LVEGGEKTRLEEIKQWNTKIKLTSSIKLGTFLESLQLHHNRTDRDLFGISFVIVGSSKKELKSLLEEEIYSGEKNLGELLLGCLKKAGWACRNDSGCLIVTKMAETTAAKH